MERARCCFVSVLLPGPYLFLSEFLDHPDHVFKSALEHLGFSSLSEMPRAFWKVQPGDPILSLAACTYVAINPLCIVSVLRNVVA